MSTVLFLDLKFFKVNLNLIICIEESIFFLFFLKPNPKPFARTKLWSIDYGGTFSSFLTNFSWIFFFRFYSLHCFLDFFQSGSSFGRVSNHSHSYSTMKQPEIESSGITGIDNGEYWPLSGKPYVDLILTKTGVKPSYSMVTPFFSPSSRPFC